MSLKHFTFSEDEASTYSAALLIKDLSFNYTELDKYYVKPLEALGLARTDIIALNLVYTEKNKAPATLIKDYLNTLMPAMKSLGIKYILCADPNYFKALTGNKTVEKYYGDAFPCKVKGYEDMQIVLTLNYSALFYNPVQIDKVTESLEVFSQLQRVGLFLRSSIIKTAIYPQTMTEIEDFLSSLHKYPTIAFDVETTGLRVFRNRLHTISFAWSKHEGGAFPIFNLTEELRTLLKEFFVSYKGNLIAHNATFDVKMCIAQIFMSNPLDYRGMAAGLDIFFEKTDCTQIITYLATNTTAGNTLGLKDLARPFAGNWGLPDMADLTQYPIEEVLEYNLIDSLACFYVYEIYRAKMIEDDQLQVYWDIYRPSMKPVTQMELVGMPMDKEAIERTQDELTAIKDGYNDVLNNSKIITNFNDYLRTDLATKKNQKLKVKRVSKDDFLDKSFNPNSGTQVGMLLHDYLELPILNTTPTGQPSTGADDLAGILNNLIEEFSITDEELK